MKTTEKPIQYRGLVDRFLGKLSHPPPPPMSHFVRFLAYPLPSALHMNWISTVTHLDSIPISKHLNSAVVRYGLILELLGFRHCTGFSFRIHEMWREGSVDCYREASSSSELSDVELDSSSCAADLRKRIRLLS